MANERIEPTCFPLINDLASAVIFLEANGQEMLSGAVYTAGKVVDMLTCGDPITIEYAGGLCTVRRTIGFTVVSFTADNPVAALVQAYDSQKTAARRR